MEFVEKKKIAFYLNAFRDGLDYSNPTVSNPGIGGTEYLFWTTSYFLQCMYPDLEIILFSKKEGDFPKCITNIVAVDELECIRKCKQNNVQYLILRGPYLSQQTCEVIDRYDMKVILWSHNFENYRTIKKIDKTKNIIKNICVSNEQCDWLYDTNIYSKSATIYNGLCFHEYDKVNVPYIPHRVCYMGNLYPRSGYETVIEAWSKIEKKYPNAELYIIGGNDLYNVNTMKLEYSLKSFKKLNKKEKRVFWNKDGTQKPNIHFMGVMGGKEKLELMASANVGIANITLAGDTFGLAAVEFQALGVPVVSINKYGVRETVMNGETGILVDKRWELANAINELFENQEKRDIMSRNARAFVRKNFSIEKIVRNWKVLFDNIEEFGTCVKRDAFFSYDNKKLLRINAMIRKTRIFRICPPILFYKYIYYGLRRLGEKLNLL